MVRRLLQDLDLKGFAAKHPLEVAHPFFEPARLGGRHHVVVRTRRVATTVGHQPPLLEFKARREPVAPRNLADLHAWLHCLGHDPELLLGRERRRRVTPLITSTPENSSAIGHSTKPGPSGYAACPVGTRNTSDTHDARNGLLLRRDIHSLFDAGYVTVTPDRRFEVSRRIREEFDNGRHYYELHGTTIQPPADITMQPDPALLRWHNENRFNG